MSALLPVAGASARVGALTQLHGRAGCVAQQSDSKAVKRACTVARFGGNQMWDAAVSPEGRNLYVASIGGAVSVLRIGKHGRLRQSPGKAGCLSRTGKLRCTVVPQLNGSEAITVSPDGRNVYVGSTAPGSGFGGVVIFGRNRRTGALHRIGCVGENGTGGCAPVRAVFGRVAKVVVSHDGRSAYVASNSADPGGAHSGALAVFARAGGGGLSQLTGPAGCLNGDGAGGCAQVRGLLPECCGVAASPNSANVPPPSSLRVLTPGSFEAQSASFALASFAKDASGALTQLPGTSGCVNHDGSDGCAAAAFGGTLPVNEAADVLISPNGRSVYVAHSSAATDFETNSYGGTDNFIAAFPRDPNGGALGALAQDSSSCGLEPLMSPDGRSVYATTGNFGTVLSLFSRNSQTGSLAPAGCIGHDAKGCREARHIFAPSAMALTPNGRYAYVVSDEPSQGETIGVFRRSVR